MSRKLLMGFCALAILAMSVLRQGKISTAQELTILMAHGGAHEAPRTEGGTKIMCSRTSVITLTPGKSKSLDCVTGKAAKGVSLQLDTFMVVQSAFGVVCNLQQKNILVKESVGSQYSGRGSLSSEVKKGETISCTVTNHAAGSLLFADRQASIRVHITVSGIVSGVSSTASGDLPAAQKSAMPPAIGSCTYPDSLKTIQPPIFKEFFIGKVGDGFDERRNNLTRIGGIAGKRIGHEKWTSDFCQNQVGPRGHASCGDWTYQRENGTAWECWKDHDYPSSGRTRRASVVFLARRGDIPGFIGTLKELHQKFLQRFPYPVTIFHEDILGEDQQRLRNAAPIEMHFERISWCLPTAMTPFEKNIPKYITQRPISYRHMCRFFFVKLFQHPALAQYKFYMRLDTHSKILGPIEFDIFSWMEQNNKKYGFNIVNTEVTECKYGLDQILETFLDQAGLSTCVHAQPLYKDFTTKGIGLHFWNNFEVVDLAHMARPVARSFADMIDRSGGLYLYRWGDAVLRTLSVGAFSEHSEVVYLKSVGYRHDTRWTCGDPENSTSCTPGFGASIMHKPCMELGGMSYEFLHKGNSGCMYKWEIK